MTLKAHNKNSGQSVSVAVPQISTRDLFNTIFYYRWFAVAIIIACFGLSAVVAFVMPPVYRAEARLLTLNAGYYDMQLSRATSRAIPAFEPSQVVNVEAQILSSPELHHMIVKEEAGADAGPEALDRAQRTFERRFHLEKVDAANMIEISYADSDPNHAAHVLERLIAQYFRQRAGVFTQGRVDFLTAQRDKVREELDQANAQLVAFQQAHGVVNIDSQINSTVALRNLLLQHKYENDSSLTQDSSTLDILTKSARAVPLSIELFRDNTETAHTLDTMQLSLLQLKGRRADLASRYMVESPFVQQMDQQISDLGAAIDEQSSHLISSIRTGHNSYYDTVQDRVLRLKSDVAGELARKTSLERQERETEEGVRRLIATANQLRRMEIDRDLLVESFKTFSRQVEDALIEQNQIDTSSSNNVRIILAPVPPSHESNPPLLTLAAGLLAGFLVAGLAVIVLSSLRETFLSPEAAERSLGLPVLCAPLSPDPPPSVVVRLSEGRLAPLFGWIGRGRKAERSGAPRISRPLRGEFGRMILAINRSSESFPKLVLLLSFRDDDGLPAIADGLVEELGTRVTRPVLLLDLSSDVPAGASGSSEGPADLADSVFSFAPAVGGQVVLGRRRPKVALPIGRQALELFDILRQRHDYIVIQAPAASRSFTGIEMSGLVDATILAVRAESTRKPVALTLKSQVEDAGGKIVGVALTNRHSYIPEFVYQFL